jgi:tagatose 1,6-diphosphate aldolase GatY/KbaY
MLAQTIDLIREAQKKHIAVGAFNTYNLEITQAVITAAEQLGQPVILQFGVSSIKLYGEALIVAAQVAARKASVPVALHLDHCSDRNIIEACFVWGCSSALADGSRLPFAENVAFTQQAVEIAHIYDGAIEAELGYLAGTEDGITIAEREASLTDPKQAQEFVKQTGIAMLAVSIGNVHGYTSYPPTLDFARLAQIACQTDVPLVLHGASGIQEEHIQQAIRLGVAKLNVNTEVRTAYLTTIAGWGVRVGPMPDPRKKGQDLLDLTQEAVAAAQSVVKRMIQVCSTLSEG